MKRNTALLIGIIAVAAIALFMLMPKPIGATVALVYDPGGGIPITQGILVQTNGTSTDITLQTMPSSSGKIVVVPSASITIAIQNAVDADQIKLEAIMSYGAATYGGSPITINPYPVGGADLMTKVLVQDNWINVKTKSLTFTVDGVLNQWGRQSVLARDLALSPPASGATKTLTVPITVTINLYINGVLKQTSSKQLTGTAVVSNIPATGQITVTVITVSTTFAPMNVIAR